ncbi:hypothetical protein P8452_03794 [Trifolium repens]|nr:hypothetical protein P8452_03794 [Trifolium repens]
MDSIFSRPFDSISQIKTGREVWKLPVKIVNIWYESDGPCRKHIEMVIMDSNCDRIQIVVPERYIDPWRGKFVEYESYVFNNFKVEDNDLLSRACQNPYKLKWFDGSFVSKENIPPIPNIKYFFKDFAEILTENFHPDDVHDVIGMVHEVTYHQRDENKVAAVGFVLKDNKQVLVECFLCGREAAAFIKGIIHDTGADPNVVIIRNAIYHAAYEFSHVSLGNGSHGTRIITDQSIPEIIDYKTSFPHPQDHVVTIKIRDLETISLVDDEAEYSGVNSNIVQIHQLGDMQQEIACVTLGITEKLCVTRDGWIFEGCAWCGGGVFVSEGYLKCSNDHRNPRVTPRYKLHVQVRHNQDRTTFVISDPACANFFGISVLELKRSLSVVDQVDARFCPLLLDSLLGLKIVAKGKWSPTFKSMFVHSFSIDQDLFDLIETKLP